MAQNRGEFPKWQKDHKNVDFLLAFLNVTYQNKNSPVLSFARFVIYTSKLKISTKLTLISTKYTARV